MDLPINKIHHQVKSLINQTDKLLIKYFLQGVKSEYKSQGQLATAIVTKADKQVEDIFKVNLAKTFPEIGFIGEESPASPKDYNWIIDPIDGTLNFAKKVPLFATSLALWHKNQPVYSAISLPMQQELISAISNQGAWLNGQPIKSPSQLSSSKSFTTYTGVISNAQKLKLFSTIIKHTAFPRYYGCTVNDGVMACLNRTNCAVMINQAIWDIGAILLLAQETNTHYQFISSLPDIANDNLKGYQYSLVMGSKPLVTKLVKKLKSSLGSK